MSDTNSLRQTFSDISYGKDFDECSVRSVAKGFAVFCIGFSLTYILQKGRINPQKTKRLFIIPSVIGSVVGLEMIRLSIGKCRQKFNSKEEEIKAIF